MNSFIKLCESYYQMNGMPMKINVSGNIGSGKSTFCDSLTQKNSKIHLVKEPVHIMRSYFDGNKYINILEEFYQGNIDGIEFQKIMIEILMKYNKEEFNKACLNPNIRCVLFDRSVIDTLEMFSRLISIDFYNEIVRGITDDIVENVLYPDLFIFIRSKGECCKKRITQRGRPEEVSIPVDYLINLEGALEEFQKKVVSKYQTIITVEIDENNLTKNQVYDSILSGFDCYYA